jgi:hypothetical protein
MRRVGQMGVRVAGVSSILASAVLLHAAQPARAEGSPTIDGTAVGNITETSATIEAQINPQGRETLYELRLWLQDDNPAWSNEFAEYLTGGPQSQFGRLAPGSEDRTVTLTVTGLHPGYVYGYDVRAGSRAGETDGKSPYWFAFHTNPYPEGYSPNRPYEPMVSFWSIFLSDDESAQVLKEYEQRQAAKRLAEQQEREQREQREAAERQLVLEEERAAGKAAIQAPPSCVVPPLRGDSLVTARRVIVLHHCRVGKIHWPRHRAERLVVVAQSPRRGLKLAHGATVALTLGPRDRHGEVQLQIS